MSAPVTVPEAIVDAIEDYGGAVAQYEKAMVSGYGDEGHSEGIDEDRAALLAAIAAHAASERAAVLAERAAPVLPLSIERAIVAFARTLIDSITTTGEGGFDPAMTADLRAAILAWGASPAKAGASHTLYAVFDGLPSGDRNAGFVELEDPEGKSHGADVGAIWSEHPTAPGFWRLGPFAAAAE